MKKLIYFIMLLITGTLACNKETGDDDLPHDHVWLVNQDGVVGPVTGTWKVIVSTHPNSEDTVGMILELPRDPSIYESMGDEGIYTASDGIMWTRVRINFRNGGKLRFLSRRVDNTVPHKLYHVFTTQDDGTFIPSYPTDPPYLLPAYDQLVLEKID